MFTNGEMRKILDQIDEIYSKHENDGYFPNFESWEIERLNELHRQYIAEKERSGL